MSFTTSQALAFLCLIRGHPLEVVFLFGMPLGLRMGEATGVLWDDIDLDCRVFYLRHHVGPDVQADGGERLCGTRCGRAAVLEDLKSEASTRGLELPEILIPELRRQALRVERARKLRLDKNKEWLEHGLVFPSAWATRCNQLEYARGCARCVRHPGCHHVGSTTCATRGDL